MRARTKTTATIAFIGIAALLAAAASPTAAQDVQVQSAVAIDGKVDCAQMKSGATHPCEGFTPPPKVAVGETFSAEGKTRLIGIVRAAQSRKRFGPRHKKGGLDLCCGRNLRGHPCGSKPRSYLANDP